MQRNAKNHLTQPDAVELQPRWRTIKAAWNLEVAHSATSRSGESNTGETSWNAG
jgi:hypothetical protein